MKDRFAKLANLTQKIQDIVCLPLTAASNDVFLNNLPDLSDEDLEVLEAFFCLAYDPWKIKLLVGEMKSRFPDYIAPKSFNLDHGIMKKSIYQQPAPNLIKAKGIKIVIYDN